MSKARLIALFRFDVDAAGWVTRRLGAPYPYGTAAGFDAAADADNRLMSVNGQPLGYDLDGNLLSAPDPLYGGVMQLGYNSRNQLTSASLRGVSVSFGYDAEGGGRR